jgi:cysteine desulfurase
VIYWDYNATAPLRSRVKQRISEAMEKYAGNASSTHKSGQEARAYIENVRRRCAESLGVKPTELIFCGSATEANFMMLWGYWLQHRKNQPNGTKKILASSLEHSSMIKNIHFLSEVEGVELVEIPLLPSGMLDLQATEELLKKEKFWMCSLYAACNESGIIYPWQELAKLCKTYNTPFHSDMVQLLGRVAFDLKDSKPNSATFAFHKSGGVKGVGLLYVSQGSPWMPILQGGGQEKKRRSGTENVLGIASIEAIFEELSSLIDLYQNQVKQVRDQFERQLAEEIPTAKIVGRELPRLPNTSYCIFPGVPSDLMLMGLDVRDIAVSAGSACSSGLSLSSHSLLRLGFSEEEARSAIRFSLGESSELSQISAVIAAIKEIRSKVSGAAA